MKEKKLRNFITNTAGDFYGIALMASFIFLFMFPSSQQAQQVTLEYIFQDTNIVNPRPTLKYINPLSSKIYYYGDDDYDGMLSLCDYNYNTGETFKYSDTGETASEFILLPNGNAVTILKGDVYITKNFAAARQYTRDIRITETDEYEYSPLAISNFVIYSWR
ncbi:MAG TPA: hypothetical protein PKA39_00765 [Ignavibacteria bacterium]|nr:hypothetical protein [Ignavibacteria bacterium]